MTKVSDKDELTEARSGGVFNAKHVLLNLSEVWCRCWGHTGCFYLL